MSAGQMEPALGARGQTGDGAGDRGSGTDVLGSQLRFLRKKD